MESTLGQLPFPKCYLSSPLFVVSAFVLSSYLMHQVGYGGCCSPLHRTHFEPSFLESNGTL